MADQHERQELPRPPFDEFQEQLEEKRRDAVRMIRAWSVAGEIYATGKSEEFGEMIARYNDTDSKRVNSMPSSENSGYGYAQNKADFDLAKASMVRAFSERGIEVVLSAEGQARAIRNTMEGNARRAQQAGNH